MSITGIPGNIPYQGIKERNPPELHISRTRSPNASDSGPQFKIGDIWVDTLGGAFFVLLSKEQGTADWAVGGGAGSGVLTVNTILPDGGGDFTITAGTNITITPGVNSISISSADAGATSFPTDAGTATEVAGVLNILGGTNLSTSGAGNTITINADGVLSDSFPGDVGTATPAAGILNILGGPGVDTTGAANTISINIAGDVPRFYAVDSGGPAIPTLNTLTVVGPSSSDFTGSGIETNVGATTNEIYLENRRFPSAFVVDASATVGNRGEFTTINAGLAAASAGDTVYVRPGTYTENISFGVPGKNLVGLCGIGEGDLVRIAGTINAPAGAGTTVLQNIAGVDSGSTRNIEAQGGAGSTMMFIDCSFTEAGNVLRFVSGDVIFNRCNLTSTGGVVVSSDSTGGGVGTFTDCVLTGNASDNTVVVSIASTLNFQNCNISGGANQVAILVNAISTVNLQNCDVSGGDASLQTISSAATININDSRFTPGFNIEAATVNFDHSAIDGAGATTGVSIENGGSFNGKFSEITSPGESAFEINAATSHTLYNMVIDAGSQWINIGGGSTLDFGGITILGDNNIGIGGTLTKTPLASSFHAFLPATVVGGTGAGAVFTLGTTTALTERFDSGGNFVPAGTFTAPVTGTYSFTVRWVFGSLAASNDDLVCDIVTTGTTYEVTRLNIDAISNPANEAAVTGTVLVQMTSGDTATFTATETGGGAASVDVVGSAAGDGTYVMGWLVS